MGIWRDLAESVGLATPSSLDDVGRTGFPCIDRCIDEAVRNDIELDRLREKLRDKEGKS